MNNKMNNLNMEPLISEIENVIRDGVKNILKDYINRYELLEETHQLIMNLPSVRNELDKNFKSETFKKHEEIQAINFKPNNTMEIDIENIKNLTKNIVKTEIETIENKFDKMENNYNRIAHMLEKICDNMLMLNEDVTKLKDKDTHTNSSSQTIIQPSIVTSSLNENIKLEIKEEEVESEKDDKDDEDKDEKDKDESDDESDEDDKDDESDEDDKDDDESDEEEEKDEDVESDEDEELKEAVEKEVEKEDAESDEDEVEELKEAVEEEVEKEDAESDEDEVEEEEEEEASKEEDEIETEASEEEQEEEEELIEIEIDDIAYCTNNEDNGFIWELSEDGEQGDKVGYLKEGEPFFYSEEK
jgi:hypothetical protein